VTIAYNPDEVYLEVTDEGRGGNNKLAIRPNAFGHGLIGMRERVSVFDGDLTAGPRAEGGFRVAAHLPLSPVPS